MKALIFALLAVALFSACSFASEVVGTGKHGPRFLFIPLGGSKTITVQMDPADTIGSVLKCMDLVHKRGGGTCRIEPSSIKSGRHNTLYRKYKDVIVTLK
jgi:hypothetical protein